MITIIDSGGANIASIQAAFYRLGVDAQLSSDKKVITKSSHLILPGVGSASSAMKRLQDLSLIEVIRNLTQPLLGICLGMQLLFDYSEEGATTCLGIIPEKVTVIPSLPKLSIPHIGWNKLKIVDHIALMKNIPDEAFVYFVHGFKAPIGNYTLAMTDYGENFTSSLQWHNFYGTQFHPERSSQIGAKILKNFLEL